jgi:hypothetical protein
VSTNSVATATATTNSACTNTAALNTNVVVHWIQWKRPSAVAQRLSLRRETRPNDPHSRRKTQCQDAESHLVHRSLLCFCLLLLGEKLLISCLILPLLPCALPKRCCNQHLPVDDLGGSHRA